MELDMETKDMLLLLHQITLVEVMLMDIQLATMLHMQLEQVMELDQELDILNKQLLIQLDPLQALMFLDQLLQALT